MAEKLFWFMECTLIVNIFLNFNLSYNLKMWGRGKNNGKGAVGYQFNNPISPLFISLICSHMVSNISSLFMSISTLILLYNMDMKRNVLMCLFMSIFIEKES